MSAQIPTESLERLSQLGRDLLGAPQKGNPMRTPEQQQIALDCLRLAASFGSPSDTVEVAGLFYAFVTGETALTPREQINAALDSANVR